MFSLLSLELGLGLGLGVFGVFGGLPRFRIIVLLLLFYVTQGLPESRFIACRVRTVRCSVFPLTPRVFRVI